MNDELHGLAGIMARLWPSVLAVAFTDLAPNKMRCTGTRAESSSGIGSPAMSVAWHPNGHRLGVSRKSGKVSVYDIRKLGSKPKVICEKSFGWELNKFMFYGDGDQVVAAYGHQGKGGFKVLQVCSSPELPLDTVEAIKAMRASLCCKAALHPVSYTHLTLPTTPYV